MRIVFIHPNFPAQFRHLAGYLGRNPENDVRFITADSRPEWEIPGVKKIVYQTLALKDPLTIPVIKQCAANQQQAEAVAGVLIALSRQQFVPDLIVGASGWGATAYVKDVFPKTPFLGYFEWYYHGGSPNVGFAEKQPPVLKERMVLRNRSLSILSDLTACDHGICPTQWQKAQFPEIFHSKLSVCHEGINTAFFKPDHRKKLALPGLDLSGAKELVTYTARGFEPYRGFPGFIQSIPFLLEKRPDAHVVLVGEDRVCYGRELANGQGYKEFMTQKVDLDPARVHFLAPLPYGLYLNVLQASTVHVYLTVPFVLSWSMLEAMACGCLVAASDTPPVREVVQDGANGVLVDFFSPRKIAQKVAACLEYPSFMAPIRQKARQTILDRFDLNRMLKRQMGILAQMISQQPGEPRRFG
ncbi:glycosyltransferase [Desulfobacter vibrioformis]|uniref:glycosyltransferase n=1 Tax=Desulfobacter vibrioformis TaxID=34031 RepID=UPI000555598F|nr:glycosyltransferase [Desulfobacter vibrioformis]